MTREEATAAVAKLAHGLDVGDEARLLERISAHDEAEELRDLLVESGAALFIETRARGAA